MTCLYFFASRSTELLYLYMYINFNDISDRVSRVSLLFQYPTYNR